jgi:hypothetical protein
MRRRSKDYRLTTEPDPLIGEPGALDVNMFDSHGNLERTYKFSVYAARPVMAAEIALAFRHYNLDKSAKTREGSLHCLRVWFHFLDEHTVPIGSMRDVDDDVLRAYVAWLDRKGWSKGTRYVVWSDLKQLIVWLKRNRPERIRSTRPIATFSTRSRRPQGARPLHEI